MVSQSHNPLSETQFVGSESKRAVKLISLLKKYGEITIFMVFSIHPGVMMGMKVAVHSNIVTIAAHNELQRYDCCRSICQSRP